MCGKLCKKTTSNLRLFGSVLFLTFFLCEFDPILYDMFYSEVYCHVSQTLRVVFSCLNGFVWKLDGVFCSLRRQAAFKLEVYFLCNSATTRYTVKSRKTALGNIQR